MRLRELRLGGVLEFVENRFIRGEKPAESRGVQPTRSLYLQKSTIRDNDVTIHRNVFAGQVFLTELEGKKVAVLQNIFPEFFELGSSNVYSFRSFGNRYLGPFSITRNRIDSSLLIDGDFFDETATRLLDVRHNRVGHDLRFAPVSWPAETFTVDFGFNDVVGPFNFYWPLVNADGRRVLACPPDRQRHKAGYDAWADRFGQLKRWAGEINLIGTKVATSMRLVEGCLWQAGGALQPMAEPQALNGWTATEHATSVDLTLVETGVLTLDLPASGAYAWRGKGLSFKFFGAPNQGQVHFVNGNAVQGVLEDRAIEHLEVWLNRLERPDPEVYYMLADYLRGRGQIDRSRTWLAKARDADFGTLNCQDFSFSCLLGWGRTAVLSPSNFGTRPEQVLIFLATVWAGMTLLYTGHHNRAFYQHRWLTRGEPWPWSAVVLAEPGAGSGNALEEEASPSGWPHGLERLQATSRQEAHYDEALGGYRTKVHGFVAHRPEDANRSFSLWSYSLDATLPVISLDRFRTFSPTSDAIRALTIVHHITGWWLVTLFFGASFF